MYNILHNLASRAQSKKRNFKQVATKLKKLKNKDLDNIFQELHDEAFKRINCLECANCCKSLGPRLTNTDMERLASFLKMKTSTFIDTYMRLDEDNDYVFQNMPCPFLLEDNYCMVYSSRPKACRDYPHTNQKNIRSILPTCIQNTETCPAVFDIFEQLLKTEPF